MIGLFPDAIKRRLYLLTARQRKERAEGERFDSKPGLVALKMQEQ
ncbi:hypothetical protein ALO62_102468 [Pseudomonas amygdali pv. myricae]|uniref:Uncharacterized protein n=1 Tax=Pseudomonas savastanoi TaxID=29438 RepID=A0A3M5G899_PSESS|nr:hypothetical protein ALO62_102468 [Pseudomonas amygdali pv. myricae]KPY53351.1 hypothetical protein ALO48_101936 [Pseudomonas syringae pv. rhaphiolepidis]RMS82310.1 hypothetical protein ALP59_102280 [Pseudomonas savastanoi]RMT53218.1 hypothetical protein ALP46_101908 [Pseudomonas amygdali pv. myricae]RMV23123.1 hypothetical protein ALP14_101896 [Pseudomonas amygdali pv. myricae]